MIQDYDYTLLKQEIFTKNSGVFSLDMTKKLRPAPIMFLVDSCGLNVEAELHY